MPPFVQYLALVVVLLAAATIYVIAFGTVAREIHKLYRIIHKKSSGRRFAKKIERFRRDFT